MSKGRLGPRRSHQIDALLHEAVEIQRRVRHRPFGEARQRVQLPAQRPPHRRPVLAHAARQDDVAHFESLRVRVVVDQEGRVLGPEEIGATRSRLPPQGHVGGQAIDVPARRRDHAPEGGMETHEGPAAHRHRRRPPGHQMVVARSVVVALVAERAQDGHLVGDLRQFGQDLAEPKSRHGGVDGSELAADLLGRVRFRIEGLVVGRSAVEPDQDAIGRRRRGRPAGGPRPQQSRKAQSGDRAQPQLQRVSPRHAIAVCSHASGMIGQRGSGCNAESGHRTTAFADPATRTEDAA